MFTMSMQILHLIISIMILGLSVNGFCAEQIEMNKTLSLDIKSICDQIHQKRNEPARHELELFWTQSVSDKGFLDSVRCIMNQYWIEDCSERLMKQDRVPVDNVRMAK